MIKPTIYGFALTVFFLICVGCASSGPSKADLARYRIATPQAYVLNFSKTYQRCISKETELVDDISFTAKITLDPKRWIDPSIELIKPDRISSELQYKCTELAREKAEKSMKEIWAWGSDFKIDPVDYEFKGTIAPWVEAESNINNEFVGISKRRIPFNNYKVDYVPIVILSGSTKSRDKFLSGGEKDYQANDSYGFFLTKKFTDSLVGVLHHSRYSFENDSNQKGVSTLSFAGFKTNSSSIYYLNNNWNYTVLDFSLGYASRIENYDSIGIIDKKSNGLGILMDNSYIYKNTYTISLRAVALMRTNVESHLGLGFGFIF